MPSTDTLKLAYVVVSINPTVPVVGVVVDEPQAWLYQCLVVSTSIYCGNLLWAKPGSCRPHVSKLCVQLLQYTPIIITIHHIQILY